jgi:hypothetical protein
VAHVLAAIWKFKLALALHVIIFPGALVSPAVWPLIYTLTVDVVLLEFSGVLGAVRPLEGTDSLLFPVNILPNIIRIIWPGFLPTPVLFVVLPFPVVACSVAEVKDAKVARLIVLPVPLVNVTVAVDQSSRSIGLVVLPEAGVLASVFPELGSPALSLIARVPLAVIN